MGVTKIGIVKIAQRLVREIHLRNGRFGKSKGDNISGNTRNKNDTTRRVQLYLLVKKAGAIVETFIQLIKYA